MNKDSPEVPFISQLTLQSLYVILQKMHRHFLIVLAMCSLSKSINGIYVLTSFWTLKTSRSFSLKNSNYNALYRNCQHCCYGEHCLHFTDVRNDFGKKGELKEEVSAPKNSACFVFQYQNFGPCTPTIVVRCTHHCK